VAVIFDNDKRKGSMIGLFCGLRLDDSEL